MQPEDTPLAHRNTKRKAGRNQAVQAGTGDRGALRRLIGAGDLARARALLERDLQANPRNPEAFALLLEVLTRQEDWAAFSEAQSRLTALNGLAPAQEAYDRGLLALRMGRFREGWAGYEARLQCPGLITPVRRFPQPAWTGEPFPGRTLLVHYEQGLGDTFMFVRFLAQVKALGGRVLLLVQPALAAVVATCPGVDEVLPEGAPLPPFDLQIALLSLPRVLGTELDTLPAAVPYLDVPAIVPNRDKLLKLLAATADQTRVGLVWAGSPRHFRDRERSIPPAKFTQLAELPGIAWFSFQLGAGNAAPALPALMTLDPWIRNFSDTAYALSGMQLVITVDTAVAHLAGALGIPTFLLVTFFPDFRWLMGREDSPWYPSVRIYRQPSPGDWDSVLARVLADLTEPG
jgi:hypothetical protein